MRQLPQRRLLTPCAPGTCDALPASRLILSCPPHFGGASSASPHSLSLGVSGNFAQRLCVPCASALNPGPGRIRTIFNSVRKPTTPYQALTTMGHSLVRTRRAEEITVAAGVPPASERGILPRPLGRARSVEPIPCCSPSSGERGPGDGQTGMCATRCVL